MCHFCEQFLDTKYRSLCNILSNQTDVNFFTLFVKSSKDEILKKIHPELTNVVIAAPMFILVPTNQLFNSDTLLTPMLYGWIFYNGNYVQIQNTKFDVQSIFEWINKMKNILNENKTNNHIKNTNVNILPYNSHI